MGSMTAGEAVRIIKECEDRYLSTIAPRLVG